jgi:hypothetical protein
LSLLRSQDDLLSSDLDDFEGARRGYFAADSQLAPLLLEGHRRGVGSRIRPATLRRRCTAAARGKALRFAGGRHAPPARSLPGCPPELPELSRYSRSAVYVFTAALTGLTGRPAPEPGLVASPGHSSVRATRGRPSFGRPRRSRARVPVAVGSGPSVFATRVVGSSPWRACSPSLLPTRPTSRA